MKRRIASFTSALIILFLMTLLYKPTVEVALGSPATTIFVNPPTSTVAYGKNFVINIEISDVSDLYGWEFKLRWNSTLLDALTVTEGNFLKQGGSTFFWPKINNTEGYILVDCTLLGNVPGINGSGTLATVKFYVEGAGESILDLYDTILINSQELSIIHLANDGTVTITNPVGGIWIPVNKLSLLAPWIALTTTIISAIAITAAILKHRKKQ